MLVGGDLIPESSRMSKIYGSVNPNQQVEHPPPVQNRLSENDPVYFILDTVTELDISTITAKYKQGQRGFPPYSPRMIVALLVYSYFRGVFSSRQIMQACKERLTFRVIVGDNIPNWRIIRDFRKLNIKDLEDLFVQVLKLCLRAGLMKMRYIGPDSIKAKAEQKEISYCQMKTEEHQLQHEIHSLLSEAEDVDKQDDQWYVTDCRRRELFEQLAPQRNHLELIWPDNVALEAKSKDCIRNVRVGVRSEDWPNHGRKHTAILDIPDEGEIRPPTWEEAAQKCIEVYREVISKHKN
jgi:transposase